MKDEQAYLLHIRDAIDRILSYTEEGRDVFLAEPTGSTLCSTN